MRPGAGRPDAVMERCAVGGAGAAGVHMDGWNAGKVEACSGGRLVRGSPECAFRGVSIDSRTTGPEELFIALRGPHHDGHSFIAAALARGAAGAVAAVDWPVPEYYPRDRFLIRTEDTHGALKTLAAARRREWRGSLVAVTGSMGKTTTKEFCAQVLMRKYEVFRSPGNFNNLFGLPLALLRLAEEAKIGIFEMGMSAAGEIAEMCRLACPDTGILTNVAPVHLEFFTSLEAIARAKGELAEALSPHGTLVYNADDPLVNRIGRAFQGHAVSFGFLPGADVRAMDVEVAGWRETRFRVFARGLTRPAVIPLAGAHYVLNALPAIALGFHYRVDEDRIFESLRQMTGASMRGQVLRFGDGITVVDDSYNSNPHALMRMIETLTAVPGNGRRLLVAGEMLELGPEGEALHRACGARAASCGVNVLVGVRASARHIVDGAVQAGMAPENTRFFEHPDEAAEYLSGILRRGDTVLIKGSRGVRLERVVEALRARFQEQVN